MVVYMNVLKKDVLNYAAMSANSNKFYILELVQEGPNTFKVCIQYGRMGQKPRTLEHEFSSEYQANHFYTSQKYKKEAKGYCAVEIDDTKSTGPVVVQTKTSKNAKEKALENIDNKVLKMIGRLYDYATAYVTQNVSTPLGQLSAKQVVKGYQILEEIEQELLKKNGTRKDFEQLSNKFYTTIPVIFGRQVRINQMMIDDFNKLNQRKDLLGVMDSVVKSQSSLTDTLQQKYDSLHIDLSVLSKRTNNFKRLKKWIDDTHGYNHHFSINIEEIYKVNHMTDYEKFNPYKVSTMELFHGSRNENILNIFQTGLKIKPASAVQTGSMFGAGIYLASESSKSANYCWGFNSNVNSKEHFYLLICETATGRIKDFDSAQSYLRKAPYGYNSVRGVKGRSLRHDEYIVYNDNQVRIKYIVEFTKG